MTQAHRFFFSVISYLNSLELLDLYFLQSIIFESFLSYQFRREIHQVELISLQHATSTDWGLGRIGSLNIEEWVFS